MALTAVEESPPSEASLPGAPDVMTSEVLAGVLATTVNTLTDWRYRRVGPPFISDKNTRRVYYLKADVLAWLHAARIETTN